MQEKMNEENIITNQNIDNEEYMIHLLSVFVKLLKQETGTPLSIIQRALVLIPYDSDAHMEEYDGYLNYGSLNLTNGIDAIYRLSLLAMDELKFIPMTIYMDKFNKKLTTNGCNNSTPASGNPVHFVFHVINTFELVFRLKMPPNYINIHPIKLFIN